MRDDRAAGERRVALERRVLNDRVAGRVGKDRAAEVRGFVAGERSAVDGKRREVGDRAAETFGEVFALRRFDPVRLVVGEIDVRQIEFAVVDERAARLRVTLGQRQIGDRDDRARIDHKHVALFVAADRNVAIFAKDVQLTFDNDVGTEQLGRGFEDNRALGRIDHDRLALHLRLVEGDVGADFFRNLGDAVLNFKRRTVFERNGFFDARVTRSQRTDREGSEG